MMEKIHEYPSGHTLTSVHCTTKRNGVILKRKNRSFLSATWGQLVNNL